MRGRIVKGVGGLYFVETDGRILECKPKGIFRKDGIKPLVGDSVTVELLPDGTGLISEIDKRISSLIRPEVANATQAVLVFALTNPGLSIGSRTILRAVKLNDFAVTVIFKQFHQIGFSMLKSALAC